VKHLGFFTAVSSNGTGNPIIWAVSHPASGTTGAPIYLYAFNPESLSGGVMHQIRKIAAGTGNSNLVPTVANGEVFVGSQGKLEIFGLKAAHKK
jgi:hypothetical protein